MSDEYISDMLDDEKLRPVRGSVWCEKYTPGRERLMVEGLGVVSVADETESGIVLISGDAETDLVKASLLVVRAIGEAPENWSVRFLDRARAGRKVDKVYPCDWENQRIEVGTVIAIRAVAGEGQVKNSRFIQVRYDEIVAIGTPLDADEIPMLPAPGWVLVEPLPEPQEASIFIGGMETSQSEWGRVLGTPRGLYGDVSTGDVVAYPLHRVYGATEYVTFEGGLRAVPVYDLLAVLEED